MKLDLARVGCALLCGWEIGAGLKTHDLGLTFIGGLFLSLILIVSFFQDYRRKYPVE